jgi:hypothetical protein
MMHPYRPFIPTLAAQALALFVSAVPLTWAAAQTPGDAQAGPEPVLSFQATGQALVFRVETGGCTIASDFHVDVQRSGRDVSVSLDRQRPDHCKGWFPEGVEIAIPYGDVGLQAADRIRLVNAVEPAR